MSEPRRHRVSPTAETRSVRAGPAAPRPAGESAVTPLTELLDRWRDDLSAWAIPSHITAGAAESPWVLPRQMFARRADRLRRDPGGPSFERAWEALDPAGSVLDVGSGAGAACLPLAPRTTTLTAVDADEEMLGLLTGRAGQAGLAALLDALTGHARRRVIVELAAVHPLTSLNPLWLRFHGLKRPERPTAGDTLAILAAMGHNPRHTEWSRPAEADYRSMAELVEVTRRRLCLPPERAGEVEAALTELGIHAGQPRDLGSSGRDV